MKLILIITFLFANSNLISCQIDESFCDINTLPADPAKLPLPKVTLTQNYQAYVERNDYKRGITENIYEFCDLTDNVAIAKTRSNIVNVDTWSYYKTNQLISIINGTCRVTNLNETYQELTPFFLTVINGEEKLVSPLSYLFQSPDSIKFVYTGSSKFVRGMPVNEWTTCLYVEKAVQKIRYSFTDPTRWTPAITTPEYDSVPVQVIVDTKDIAGTISTDFYEIHEFRPFLALKQEGYFTPPGAYCPGRESLIHIPLLPSSFQVTREVVIPSDDLSINGATLSVHESYDFDYELIRVSMNQDQSVYSNVHDFKTGLNYKFNLITGECEVSKLSDTIKDENLFFDFEDTDYQYTGKRFVDGVQTDVWIGRKMFKGEEVSFEWCFLADGWNRPDELYDNAAATPILLTIYFGPDIRDPTKPKPSHYHHFYNYQATDEILLSHDFSRCNNSLSRKRFIFSIPKANEDDIKSFITLFEVSAIKKLHKLAKVTVLRISNIETTFDRDGVYVLFTLSEKSSFYGNAIPEIDVPLENAIENLKNAFSKQFEITVQPAEIREIVVKVNANTLNEITGDSTGYIKINKLIYNHGFTSGDVAAVTIIVLLTGFMFSVLLLVMHKVKKIKLPFLNAE